LFLRQLEYLVSLARHQNFSRAALHCNVSQPTLSNAIRQLELELGAAIVLRHQRFQGLTPEGQRIVEWSKRILSDRSSMLQELSALRHSLTGRLRLGTMPTSTPVLPMINRRFLAAHPGTSIEVSFLGAETLRLRLINFELDAGITYIDQEQPAQLQCFPLYKEHLSLLIPAESDHSGASQVSWREAAKLKLCLLPPHMHERQVIDAAFASVGEVPVPQIESDSIVNLAFHTMFSGFATIVPSHFALVVGGFPGTRIVRLAAPEVTRQVGLVWVDGDPMLPMAKALLATLKPFSVTGDAMTWFHHEGAPGWASNSRVRPNIRGALSR
jgi:DNA-binding transcriptional LysR family regulator